MSKPIQMAAIPVNAQGKASTLHLPHSPQLDYLLLLGKLGALKHRHVVMNRASERYNLEVKSL